MKYIEFEVNTGEKNMQIDNDLLEFAIKINYRSRFSDLHGPRHVFLWGGIKVMRLDLDLLKSKEY